MLCEHEASLSLASGTSGVIVSEGYIWSTSATPGSVANPHGSDIIAAQCKVAGGDEDEIDEDGDHGTVNMKDLITECQPVHNDDAEATQTLRAGAHVWSLGSRGL